MNTIVELENIKKEYNDGKYKTSVIKNISLKVERGKVYSIIGDSGSGKTTLLSIIGKLIKPTSGKYLFDGDDVSNLSESESAKFRNRSIGFVVQDFALIYGKTVEENIIMPLLFSDRKINELKIQYDLITNKLDIAKYNYQKVENLSGGQKQRVAIARALINEPKLILADEPTGSLDSQKAKEVFDLFLDLKKQDTTILIATHNHKLAQICDEIIQLDDGYISEIKRICT